MPKPQKNIRMKVHAYTDCVMLKLEKQINQLAEVPRHSLFENNLARLFPIYSILIPVYIFRILPWPQKDNFAAYVQNLSFTKEEISTHRSVVSEPDPSAAVPAAPDPAVVAPADVVAAVEAVLLSLGLRGRQGGGRQAQERGLRAAGVLGDGVEAASDAVGVITRKRI